MIDFNTDLAVSLIFDGASPEAAISMATTSDDPSELNFDLVVVGGGGLSGVPDPSCVAAILGPISNPTRADIERAIHSCWR